MRAVTGSKGPHKNVNTSLWVCVPPTTVLEVCRGPHTSRGLLKVNVAFRVHSSANESRNNNVLEGQSCRVASLSTTHKKTRRGNKRRTCFPDVSV